MPNMPTNLPTYIYSDYMLVLNRFLAGDQVPS